MAAFKYANLEKRRLHSATMLAVDRRAFPSCCALRHILILESAEFLPYSSQISCDFFFQCRIAPALQITSDTGSHIEGMHSGLQTCDIRAT